MSIEKQRHASNVPAPDPSELVIDINTPGATISGGPADDTIVAGTGLHQILVGGGGQDVFQFNGTGYQDTIIQSPTRVYGAMSISPDKHGDIAISNGIHMSYGNFSLGIVDGGSIIVNGNSIIPDDSIFSAPGGRYQADPSLSSMATWLLMLDLLPISVIRVWRVMEPFKWTLVRLFPWIRRRLDST